MKSGIVNQCRVWARYGAPQARNPKKYRRIRTVLAVTRVSARGLVGCSDSPHLLNKSAVNISVVRTLVRNVCALWLTFVSLDCEASFYTQFGIQRVMNKGCGSKFFKGYIISLCNLPLQRCGLSV